MRLNRVGFTLVELLVVIVILGIITGISIPLIRNIQASNEMKKYTTYMDSLKNSAKLYVDSYAEDLFGHEESGCAIIQYNQMEEKGLLKDIALGDVSCDSEKTFVKVVKVNNKYGYYTSIGCGKKDAAGKVEVETKLPENELSGLELCGADQKTIISFSTTPESSYSINNQRKNITIHALSPTGFHEDFRVNYSFVKKEDVEELEISKENPQDKLIGGWIKLPIEMIGGALQKNKIYDGENITISSKKIQTPINQTEDLYIVLNIENVKDLTGRNWTTEPDKSKYLYLGPFRVDNSKPIFDDVSGVVSSKEEYNDIQPKLNIKVADTKFSTEDDLKMCISYDSDTCSKKISDIKNNNGYEKYISNKVLDNIQDEYDGSSHTVYVTVGDAAGNYETKNYNYTIAHRYTLTYNVDGGSACSPSKKTVTYNVGSTVTWGPLCETTKNDYDFLGWYNGETRITSETPATGNITVKANWKQRKCASGYYMNSGGCSQCPSTHPYSAEGSTSINNCYKEYTAPKNCLTTHTVLQEGKNFSVSGMYVYDTDNNKMLCVESVQLFARGASPEANSEFECKALTGLHCYQPDPVGTYDPNNWKGNNLCPKGCISLFTGTATTKQWDVGGTLIKGFDNKNNKNITESISKSDHCHCRAILEKGNETTCKFYYGGEVNCP